MDVYSLRKLSSELVKSKGSIMNYLILFPVLLALVCAEVPETPAFLHTCSMDVPDMNACVIQKAKETLPGLLKGYKKFKIPSFLPLKLKEVTMNAGNIVFKLMDMELYGLESTELIESMVDVQAQRITGVATMKQVHVNGTYDVDGQIMVLPIKGHGPGYLQFDGIKVSVLLDYKIEPRDGYNYMILTHLGIDYTVQSAAFNFEGLFNGDKALGDQMNKFLNENWEAFHADLKPAIRNMLEAVVNEMSQAVLKYVPMEVMFPGWGTG